MAENVFNLLSCFNQQFRWVKNSKLEKHPPPELRASLHCFWASVVEKSDTILIEASFNIQKSNNDVSSGNPWVSGH